MTEYQDEQAEEPRDSAVPGEQEMTVGDRYEFTYGPASARERTLRGVLEGFDPQANTYTFSLDDGSTVSLVDHEVGAVRRLDEDG